MQSTYSLEMIKVHPRLYREKNALKTRDILSLKKKPSNFEYIAIHQHEGWCAECLNLQMESTLFKAWPLCFTIAKLWAFKVMLKCSQISKSHNLFPNKFLWFLSLMCSFLAKVIVQHIHWCSSTHWPNLLNSIFFQCYLYLQILSTRV